MNVIYNQMNLDELAAEAVGLGRQAAIRAETLRLGVNSKEVAFVSRCLVLLRMPLVLGAVLLMGIAVVGMKLALEMKRNYKKEQVRLADSLAATDNFDLAWQREHSQPQRIKDMTNDLFLEIAEATELACQIRGDYAIQHAQGKSVPVFTVSVNMALQKALASYDPEIQRLVAAAMPPTIPYATLPSTKDLGPADREALIEHGMALKTLSTNQALKEMKKCA